MAVLDYHQFIEFACEESSGGVYASWPSRSDVSRAAGGFIPTALRPNDSQRVTQSEMRNMIQCLSMFESYRHQSFGQWTHVGHCPYCGTQITPRTLKGDAIYLKEINVRACETCGWWDTEESLHVDQWNEFENDRTVPRYSAKSVHRRAILKQFSIADIELPLSSLRDHLIRHREDIRHISPSQLEDLVGHVFRELLDCEVKHLGGPGDGGIDLLLVTGDATHAVQVKRRINSETAEPVSSIREFLGAMILNGSRNGIFISTAARFSTQARDAALLASERGAIEFMELKQARDIHAMFAQAARNRPTWEEFRTPLSELRNCSELGRDVFFQIFTGDTDWKCGE